MKDCLSSAVVALLAMWLMSALGLINFVVDPTQTTHECRTK